MSRPVTVSEAQDQLLETAFDLYRIMQRLHHQHEGLKAQYERVREFYEAREPPADDEPRSLELQVAEGTDMAVDQLEGVAQELLKTTPIRAGIRHRARRISRSPAGWRRPER